MEQRYTLWKTGYNVSHALYVEIVGETEKAYKFKELGSPKGYTFFMPKKACQIDSKNEGIMTIKSWFNFEGFVAFLFDRYASHYAR